LAEERVRCETALCFCLSLLRADPTPCFPVLAMENIEDEEKCALVACNEEASTSTLRGVTTIPRVRWLSWMCVAICVVYMVSVTFMGGSLGSNHMQTTPISQTASLTETTTFTLNVHVTDLDVRKAVEVTAESHVGFVMLEIVEQLDVTSDFSDHGLWWPAKKIWLTKARLSLAHYGITSSASLHFTPIHKSIRLEVPDRQSLDIRLNMAVDTLHAVSELCAELGIRHPEELSLMKKLSISGGGNSYDLSDDTDDALNPHSTALSQMLVRTPSSVDRLHEPPKTRKELASLNANWLSSAESLMQQDIRENTTLLLRFKYYNFFDLNPKIDEVRINQLFQQATWEVLTEQLLCTEEQAMTLAALMFQVRVAEANGSAANQKKEIDDSVNALNELQSELHGGGSGSIDELRPHGTKAVATLTSYMALVKMKALGIKSVKRYFFVFKDTHIAYYKQQSEHMGPPIRKVNLKGAQVIPNVNVAKAKYHIKLRLPGDLSELEIACDGPDTYVKWMAACRLAAKGKTLADPTYDVEMSGVRTFLSMQEDNAESTVDTTADSTLDVEDYLPPRVRLAYTSKQLAARILEAHNSFKKLGFQEAKMNYIRQWQSLPDFGITWFRAKFRGGNKGSDDAVGVGPRSVVSSNFATRIIHKTYRYSAMKNWHVNWETREMIISMDSGTVAFSTIGCDIRIVHEFIGGYIFLSMRKDVDAPLDDEMFYKLTGGWGTIGGGDRINDFSLQ